MVLSHPFHYGGKNHINTLCSAAASPKQRLPKPVGRQMVSSRSTDGWQVVSGAVFHNYLLNIFLITGFFGWWQLTERNFPILLLTVVEAIEVNRDAHGKQQKVTSDFVGIFFSNPYWLNHTKIEKHLLLVTTNTNIFSQQYKQLKTDGKREFCCLL